MSRPLSTINQSHSPNNTGVHSPTNGWRGGPPLREETKTAADVRCGTAIWRVGPLPCTVACVPVPCSNHPPEIKAQNTKINVMRLWGERAVTRSHRQANTTVREAPQLHDKVPYPRQGHRDHVRTEGHQQIVNERLQVVQRQLGERHGLEKHGHGLIHHGKQIHHSFRVPVVIVITTPSTLSPMVRAMRKQNGRQYQACVCVASPGASRTSDEVSVPHVGGAARPPCLQPQQILQVQLEAVLVCVEPALNDGCQHLLCVELPLLITQHTERCQCYIKGGVTR